MTNTLLMKEICMPTQPSKNKRTPSASLKNTLKHSMKKSPSVTLRWKRMNSDKRNKSKISSTSTWLRGKLTLIMKTLLNLKVNLKI